MALVVNTNLASLNAQRQLNSNTNEMSDAMERLSSGKRINTASDDAAGLAISTRMTSQVKGLTMAIRNANDGISLVQTAEGALDEVTDMLQRMRELAIQSSNLANSDADRSSLNDEVTQLKAEVDRIATTTRFNNQSILDGSYSGNLQIGDQADQNMQISISNFATSAMGETPDGLATSPTAAVLTVDGVSTDSADYEGKSFDVTVNGVTSTVTLPNVGELTPTAAAATLTLQGEDQGPATSFAIGTDSYNEATVDLSGAADRVLQVRGLGDAFVNVDFSQELADIFGVTINELDNPDNNEASLSRRVTSETLVSAMNTAFANEASLSGDAAVTVAVNDKGFIEFSNSAGSSFNVAVKEGYTADAGSIDGTFVKTFIDTAVTADGADATRSLGLIELDMTDDAFSAFNVKVNGAASFTSVDILSKLNDTNYIADRDNVMGYELVNVLQAALDENFTGDDAVTVGMGSDGKLSFSVAGGDRTIVFAESTYDVAGTATDTTFATNFTGTSTISNKNETKDVATAIAAVTELYGDDNFVMAVRVNGGQETNIDMVDFINANVADTAAITGDEVATFLQAAFDANFSGDDAVTVALNTDGQLEFSVAKADGTLQITGADMDLSGSDGSFLTTFISSAAIDINQGIQGSSSGKTPEANAGTLNPAYGTFKGSQELVDPVVQLDSSRVTPFDDVNKSQFHIDLSNSEYNFEALADTAAATGVFSIVLDDGIAESAFEVDLASTSCTMTELTSALNALVTAAASDPDSSLNRYSFAEVAGGDAGTGITVTHADGRTVEVKITSDHTAGSAEIDVDNTAAGTAQDTLLTTSFQVADQVVGNDLTTSSNRFHITLDGTAKSVIDIDDGDYHSLENLAASLQFEIDQSGDFEGEDAINVVVREYTSETAVAGSPAVKYLAFESAFGKIIQVAEGNTDGTTVTSLTTGAASASSAAAQITSELANTNIYAELGVEPDETAYITHGLIDGGVDTTADRGLVSFSVESDGNEYSYQLSMTQNANMSFADFTSELVTKANAAFAGAGISFSSSTDGDQFSLSMDQAGANSFTISGAIIDDAFGGSVTAAGSAAGSNQGDMDDVASNMNDDLSGTGIDVTYDSDNARFVFTDNSGNTGASSSIELSGDDLADMEFAGVLTASGTASDATATTLAAIDISDTDGAEASLTAIDNALEYVSSQRAELGAVENRLTHTVNNLANVVENTSAARSRIEDADFAVEAANLAKAQVMQQAGTAMLAQANASAQIVLSLLG